VTLLDRDYKIVVNRKRSQRLRREIGVETIWHRPRTSIPIAAHRKYAYLLDSLDVTHSDQVCCADITYVPLPHVKAYFCAVMDWHSRKVLGSEGKASLKGWGNLCARRQLKVTACVLAESGNRISKARLMRQRRVGKHLRRSPTCKLANGRSNAMSFIRRLAPRRRKRVAPRATSLWS
jgi:hypothetical protein